MRLLRLVLVPVVALVSACAHGPGSSTRPLDEAAAAAASGTTAARTRALAGFHALYISGDARAARAHFEAAVTADAGEPYALHGLALLALREGHPERALTLALDLCERQPTHPLASAAARQALDLAGTATSLDDTLRARVPAVLAQGPRGDAAFLLRSALSVALLAADDLPGNAALLADMGVPTALTLVGPFSPWHQLSMADVTPAEKTGALDGLPPGPYGPLTPRRLVVADGRLALSGEPGTGDVYVAGVDFTAPERGDYVVRAITAMDHVAVLDGTPVLTRATWQRPAPTLTETAVRLDAGAHRLLVRMAREGQAGHLTVAVMRLDGRPAALALRPAQGAAPRWDGARVLDDGPQLYPSAHGLYAALRPEVGDALARVLAARDALGRHHDGARELLAGLPPHLASPALASLRADLALLDRAVPSRVARGRATRELEAVLQGDPADVHARLASAQLALDDGRLPEALEMTRQARAALSPPGGPVLALEARVALQLGLDAAADTLAQEAVAALPGQCEALELRYDLTRRRDAVGAEEEALTASARCPNALQRRAEHEKGRGHLDAAAAAWSRLLERDATQVPLAAALAQVRVAQRRFDDAVAVLAPLRTIWPRNDKVVEQLADVMEHAGKPAEALALREQALALDQADLTLRRAVTRARTGKEVLDEHAISTEAALDAYRGAPGVEDATSAYLLDAAAVRVFPDGAQVDRIHVIQKALDQAGVQDVAEVTIPQGAQVLKLRTLKKDGTVLEPEAIEGKDAISLPNVQVGDAVETEYLLAHPARGPGQPGFTSSTFYFQVARQPNNWSTYTVVAPRGTGLTVEARRVTVAPVKTEGDEELFFHEEKRVAPWVPEPSAPPTPNEWLPLVTVGAGQQGTDGVVVAYADASLDNGRITAEVEAFARQAAGAAQGEDVVKAVYAAVMQKLQGRDAGLGTSASASVAQDRGSRTWLLVAALRALGFEARLAAVRTATTDPQGSLFPNEALYPYVCVHVALPAGRAVWLDGLVRFAPYGELPEWALGGREALLMPEPGRPLERAVTPPRSGRVGKDVRLEVTLAEDGVLSGQGTETYQGYEAAQLGEALESLSPDQRDQALQGSLSRYFGGADMTGISVESKREVGAPVKVAYRFTARHAARRDPQGRLVLTPLTFPAMLGRRFLQVSARQTPLFVDGSEATHTTVTATLPPGLVLSNSVPSLTLENASGRIARKEAQVGATLRIEEDTTLLLGRVSPADYPAFAQWAGQVDLLQQRDLVLEAK